ncbi:hypothetical protein [Deinococcus apachensis]|uniref:hypothetical protein n=1 Tax=Deinococcus apachensis TaxID=309886 RepID=UPI00036AFF63|nr:hypothetical protein [Deinococcus apachensis]
MPEQVLYIVLDPATGLRVLRTAGDITAGNLKYLRWKDSSEYGKEYVTGDPSADLGRAIRVEASTGRRLPKGKPGSDGGSSGTPPGGGPGPIVTPPGSQIRSRNPDELQWESITQSLRFTNASVEAGITDGTYQLQTDGSVKIPKRNLWSRVIAVPCIYVDPSVTRLLDFDGWSLRGSGATGGTGKAPLIYGVGSRIRVRNTLGFGGQPIPGVKAYPNRFIVIEGAKRVEIISNEMYKTSGNYLPGYSGGNGPDDGLIFRQNYAEDLDGRYTNPDGTWTGLANNSGHERIQMLQLTDWRDFYADIAFNRVKQNPLYGAGHEDIWNLFNSSGTAIRNLIIREFLLENLATSDPNFVANPATWERYGWYADKSERASNNGGGLTDGPATNPANVPHHVAFEDFAIISCMGSYMIAIASGWNNAIRRGTIVHTGAIYNPLNPRGYTLLGKVNPSYVLDYYNGESPDRWFGHVYEDMVVGVHHVRSQSLTWYDGGFLSYRSSPLVVTQRNITRLPPPASVPDDAGIMAGLKRQDDYRDAKLADWKARNIQIGAAG